jgi:hypothetical protein
MGHTHSDRQAQVEPIGAGGVDVHTHRVDVVLAQAVDGTEGRRLGCDSARQPEIVEQAEGARPGDGRFRVLMTAVVTRGSGVWLFS